MGLDTDELGNVRQYGWDGGSGRGGAGTCSFYFKLKTFRTELNKWKK